MENPVRCELLDALHNGILQVRFVKVNGEERIMTCTLAPEYLPKDIREEETHKRTRKENPEVISAWDTNKGAWRSFRLENVLSAKVI